MTCAQLHDLGELLFHGVLIAGFALTGAQACYLTWKVGKLEEKITKVSRP